MLRWTGLGSDFRYDVQVGLDPDLNDRVLSVNIPGDHVEFVAPGVGQTYFWRVRARSDAEEYDWTEASSFTVGEEGPLVVTLLKPDPGATNQSKVLDLSWTTVSAARSYHVQISDRSDFSNMVVDKSDVSTNTYRATGLKGATTYHWRVAGVDNQDRSTFSHPRAFTTVTDAPAAIELISPQDKAVHVPRVSAYSWSPRSTATSYQLQIALDGDFSKVVLNDSALVETKQTLTQPLAYGTSYFWRVRGRNAGGNGAWSAVRGFTTIVASPGSVSLVKPVDGSQDVSLSPVLAWAAQPSALMYQLQVAEDRSMSQIVVDDSAMAATEDSLQVLLENEKTYYWRVRARNAGGDGVWSEVWSFTTIPAAPESVALIAPQNNERGVSVNPVLSWSGMESATTYEFAIATDSQMSRMVVHDSALASPFDTLEVSLENGTDYYWHVRGNNAGGHGPWSDVWSFRTEVATPGAVTLGSPTDGTAGVPPYASLAWQLVEDVLGYHLQLASDSSFSAMVVDESLLLESSITLAEPLPYGTSFYWHVRAGRADGLGKSTGVIYGPWSETRSFTVAIGTAVEGDVSVPGQFALYQNYPNPFNPTTTIQYDLAEGVLVRLTVFDALGRAVEILVNGQQSAGRYSAVWDAGTLPSGAYFVHLDAGTFSTTRRLLLMK
jgi:hypothetical protein